MSRRALLLTLAAALVLLAVSVLMGFRGYTRSVVIAHDQPAVTGDSTVPQYRTVVLHCPGPFASMANVGAYYPVSGYVVSPPGPRPVPCLIRRGRLQLEVWVAIGITSLIAAGALIGLWRQARDAGSTRSDPFFEPI